VYSALKELGIVSYAITMTATILGVAILMIGATTEVNQARAVYGCITFPGTRSTSLLHFVLISQQSLIFGNLNLS